MSDKIMPHTGTLCWHCKHAVPKYDKKGRCIQGCNWSLYKRPVIGWNASKEYITFKGKRTPSYDVRECPQFERG